MSKPIYPIIFVLLGSVLEATPLSAVAQTRLGLPDARSMAHRGTPLASPMGAQLGHRPLSSHKFHGRTYHGRVYHGRLAWRHGRWHHGWRNGRFGWWWDVGGLWYFYPELIEGPPDYVSDIEVADEPATIPSAQIEPAAPEKPQYVFFYHPGDLLGTRYETLEECLQARQKAGNVGVCVRK
jgi:hypothetical protein